jgi:hypothetical protein
MADMVDIVLRMSTKANPANSLVLNFRLLSMNSSPSHSGAIFPGIRDDARSFLPAGEDVSRFCPIRTPVSMLQKHLVEGIDIAGLNGSQGKDE